MQEYSNDGGRTWEGPFSGKEMSDLRNCGVLGPNTLVRAYQGADSTPVAAAAPVTSAPAPAPSPASALATPAPAIAQRQDGAYYAALPGAQPTGPYSMQQLERMVADGSLPQNAVVWKQGWASWLPVMSLFTPMPGASEQEGARDIGDVIADVVGAKRVKSFGLKSFFGDIFAHHPSGDMEEFFCSGGPKSVPALGDVKPPRPWIYTRILGLFAVLLLAFHFLSKYSPAGILCFSVALNFSVPFVMLVLFAEINVRRDVSWYKILQMFFMGGVCSLIFTFLISEQTGPYEAYWAGPVEETAKLMACLLVAGPAVRRGGDFARFAVRCGRRCRVRHPGEYPVLPDHPAAVLV